MAQTSFGQSLQQILRDRRCSIVQLQKKLGYKSATTVSRVLHDTSSISLAERLFQQLLLADFLSLSETELSSLQQALRAGKGGQEQAGAYERLNRLFFSSPAEEDIFFREFTPSGEKQYSLSQWKESLESGFTQLSLMGEDEHTPFEWTGGLENVARIDGIVFGSFPPSMMAHFVSLASTLPAGTVNVRHFIEVGTDPLRLADLLLSLRAVFFCPWYETYFNTLEESSVDPTPVFLCHMAVFRFETRQGKVDTFEIHLADTNELYLWKHAGSDAPYASLNALAASTGEFKNYRPARKELMEKHSLSELITLYRRLYFMERDRTLRVIISTMSMCYVPIEIMLRYAHEHPIFSDAFSVKQDFAKSFIELHTARYENIYKKKKPTYMILSKEALRRFANEGVMHDHPYGFPPFTVEDRLIILGVFVKNCRENPYFHIYMAHESFRFGDASYCCFANLGLDFCESDIHYHVETPIHEVVLAIDGILRLFESYFDDELLKKHVDNEASSLYFLEGLLAELQARG